MTEPQVYNDKFFNVQNSMLLIQMKNETFKILKKKNNNNLA